MKALRVRFEKKIKSTAAEGVSVVFEAEGQDMQLKYLPVISEGQGNAFVVGRDKRSDRCECDIYLFRGQSNSL